MSIKSSDEKVTAIRNFELLSTLEEDCVCKKFLLSSSMYSSRGRNLASSQSLSWEFPGRRPHDLRAETKTIATVLAGLRCAELSITFSPTKSIVLEVWLRRSNTKCCDREHSYKGRTEIKATK
uniref:Uncharacterized protein n=1 Tax=Glossina palpalis gambiensis TaxID=67801 RepID=A0A1B0BVL6_9MUSC